MHLTSHNPLRNRCSAALATVFVIVAMTLPSHTLADEDAAKAIPTPEELAAANPGRIVYLDIWASWCVPCRDSFPFMNRLVAERAGTVKVIAVNIDEDRAQADAFLERHPADFEILHDPDGHFVASLKPTGMPMSYLIGPDGTILGKHSGFKQDNAEEMLAEIDAIAAKVLP